MEEKKKNHMMDLCGGVYGIAVHELTEEELEQYPVKPDRAFLVTDTFGSHEAGSKAGPSRHTYDRHEAMRRVFQKLPAHYILGSEEYVELVYWPRGKDEPVHKEYFRNLEQASARAVSLGPCYDISVKAVAAPGMMPWGTNGRQTLVRWLDNFGPPANGVALILEPLRQAEPSLVCREYLSDWQLQRTWEASWFYYSSRCPIRAQIEERQMCRQDAGEAEGENSSTPLEKLTEHGWFRNRNLITGSAKSAMDNATMDEDPIVRLIRSVVIFDGAGFYKAYPKASTAEEVINAAGGEEGCRYVGWPSSPREMHERLVRIAPTLQTKNLIADLKPVDYYAHAPEFSTSDSTQREGYIHCEHWRKEGAAEEEGIWVFMAVEPGCCAPEEAIEETVWAKVKTLQGST